MLMRTAVSARCIHYMAESLTGAKSGGSLQVTQLFTGYVSALLSDAARSPQAWKAKDAAMYLISALAVRGKTAAHGATATNQLVNVADFFESQVTSMHEYIPCGRTCAARQTQLILRLSSLHHICR